MRHSKFAPHWSLNFYECFVLLGYEVIVSSLAEACCDPRQSLCPAMNTSAAKRVQAEIEECMITLTFLEAQADLLAGGSTSTALTHAQGTNDAQRRCVRQRLEALATQFNSTDGGCTDARPAHACDCGSTARGRGRGRGSAARGRGSAARGCVDQMSSAALATAREEIAQQRAARNARRAGPLAPGDISLATLANTKPMRCRLPASPSTSSTSKSSPSSASSPSSGSTTLSSSNDASARAM